MTAEHLLDAIGLVDDELIQEAEGYSAPRRRRNPGMLLAWAASFTVVLVLSYGLTHLGMGGGGAAPGNKGMAGESQGAGSVTNAPSGGGDVSYGDGLPVPEPGDPAAPGETGPLSILVDGGLYRSTGELVQLSPGEGEVRYGLSWFDEQSVQSRPEPDRPWLMLEDGTVAVSWDAENKDWLIFAPTVEP